MKNIIFILISISNIFVSWPAGVQAFDSFIEYFIRSVTAIAYSVADTPAIDNFGRASVVLAVKVTVWNEGSSWFVRSVVAVEVVVVDLGDSNFFPICEAAKCHFFEIHCFFISIPCFRQRPKWRSKGSNQRKEEKHREYIDLKLTIVKPFQNQIYQHDFFIAYEKVP
ncbi:hypothetical protein TRFO_27098 [Tritrichomonas foetus]|uniref:Uncharacterized protein n=1 Tax=Tritrichomonas foetus TaxID=1144522 RepID=A0A1J4K723_9EUKA|nr:hypothetical protein TRFO_27098 [Tritrichomonas foetus]|eukprot:OHT05229.1 hypothetical protein TRFO_27098 [Tritrichomonas foetus]